MKVSRRSLKQRLDSLCETLVPSILAVDPVQFPRRYARAEDREIAGFIAAALSYGRLAQIRRSVERVLACLGDRPARAVRKVDARRAARDLEGFAHRFSTGRDVAFLLRILDRLLAEHGSLEEAFLAGFHPSHGTIGPALTAFTRRALAVDVSPLAPGGRVPPAAGVRFFFPSPEDGSACKRLNMFLRWMVRRDAVDLGVWRGVPTSSLVMPVDTHVARVSRALGLTPRRSADWRMALEVTEALREFDPEDPVRYDRAIYGLGLSTPARGVRAGRVRL